MLTAAFVLFFVLATLGGLAGLVVLDFRLVPPITCTWALIITLAALGVAVLR